MDKCLVTKLKGIVDNYNLPILNGLLIPFITSTQRISARAGGYDSSHPVKIKGVDCWPYNTDGTIRYDNPYESVGDYAITLKEMGASPYVIISDIDNLAYFNFTNLNGNTLLPDGTTPEDWSFSANVLKYCTHMKDLRMAQCTVYINTEDLELMTSLEYLSLPSASKYTNVDLVTLVKAWIVNGRSSSGSINGQFETGCKFNGVNLYQYHAYTDRTLTWESSTKIWLPAGNNILCVGYSDSEISTRTASGGIWEGKTIVKCD